MRNMDELQLFKVRLLWEKIDKILHMKDCHVKGLSYIKSHNSIHLGSDNKLHLCFQSKFNNDLYKDFGCVLPEIELQNGNDTFVIPCGYATYDDNMEVFSDILQEYDIKINRIDNGTLEENLCYYWRYVYPIDFNKWFLQIESSNYVDDRGIKFGFSYLKLKLGGCDMPVFVTEQNGEYYMVIQSGEKIDSEEMYKRVFAIKTTIGLITGIIFGDYHFQIASDDKDFASIKSMIFGSLDETKHCSYRIVNNKWVNTYDLLGRYEYQKYAQRILEDSGFDLKMYYDNKPLEDSVFEKLTTLCYNNNDIVISASMLLEGSLQNVIYQPSFYYVALEAITSALKDNEQDKTNTPLKKEEYNKYVKPSLLKALDAIIGISCDVKRIYRHRIESNLNSPANQDKLSILFEMYGYILTDEDKKVINLRNYIFHGRLSNIKKELSEQRWEMFAIALRLHKLCCILLLKASGFNGKILNNEVIWGVKEACERKEPPYLNI